MNKMLLPSSLPCFILLGSLLLISLVYRGFAGLEYSTCTTANTRNELSFELVVEAIDLLSDVALSPSANKSGPLSNESYMLKILQAIELLHDASGITEHSTSDTIKRRLEEDIPDDDDYFSQYDDVKVTYDSDNDTVVTVGEDVIVVVEHGSYHYIVNSVMLLCCMGVGALMSGLLMGVMTLDPLMLGVKSRSANTSEERIMAMKLMPFSQNKNLVLVSILIVNCAVNEALPVFFDALLDSPWLSILCALTVVLLVGEILPSAYFTGTDQVRIAFKLIPVLRFVIILTSPISYPLGKLMDKYFHEGDDRSAFKRGELSALVRIQYEERLASQRREVEIGDVQHSKSDDTLGPSGPCDILGPLSCVIHDDERPVFCNDIPVCREMDNEIDSDDIAKVEGALTLKTKKVRQSFTPLRQVVAVTADTVLDETKIVDLYSKGYSRIPVFKEFSDGSGISGICGILLTKQLIMVRKEDRRLVSTLTLYRPPCVSPDTNFSDALNKIQSGNSRKSSNMALVCTNPDLASVALREGQPVPLEAGVLGIITLENILEELIQEQIFDEKDRKFKPATERLKWAVAKWKVFTLRRRLEREKNAEDDDEDDHPFNFVELREIV